MDTYTIGILSESREKESRAPLSPTDAHYLLNTYKNLKIKVEPSKNRVYNNEEYAKAGAEITNTLSNCDILIGLKEVKKERIIEGKTYLFFAHVAKMQNDKKDYLKSLVSKNITLIDYEYLTQKSAKRIAAFGYWAGIAGAYIGMSAIGKAHNCFNLPEVSKFNNADELYQLLSNIEMPAVKIAISGTGNSSKGVIDTLKRMNIEAVKPDEILSKEAKKSIYTVLSPRDYFVHKQGIRYSKTHFKQNPHQYESILHRYVLNCDVYFACHYWEKGMPVLLDKQQLSNTKNRLRIITDISCDINGPIASSIKETSINAPFYDYNPLKCLIEPPFSSVDNIHVSTVPNLPSMLPFDSTNYFSGILAKEVLPLLIAKKENEIIKNATIIKQGHLTFAFGYLNKFINS
ncbi:MAG: hypothetical protein JW735_07465 [Prolixibacteraceae bacterium]|nr:hypothetical protein [Prolixibacteraceae bacterium]